MVLIRQNAKHQIPPISHNVFDNHNCRCTETCLQHDHSRTVAAPGSFTPTHSQNINTQKNKTICALFTSAVCDQIPILLTVWQSGLSICRPKRSSVKRSAGISQPAPDSAAPRARSSGFGSWALPLCSLVGLWSLCEMSTGVNEYPLLQSLANPHNKMHNSLIKSATEPGGRPAGIQLWATQGFFTLWCPKPPAPLFLYILYIFILLFFKKKKKKSSAKIGCSYYLGFAASAGGANNGSVRLPLKATSPHSSGTVFCSILLFLFLISAPLFHLLSSSSALALYFSSPPRCEQVIGWSSPYNPFVVGKALCPTQQQDLHFFFFLKTCISFRAENIA